MKKDVFIDLSCKVSNVVVNCNRGDSVILTLNNNQFTVDLSQSFNPYGSVSIMGE